jgi:hypothetical protein
MSSAELFQHYAKATPRPVSYVERLAAFDLESPLNSERLPAAGRMNTKSRAEGSGRSGGRRKINIMAHGRPAT